MAINHLFTKKKSNTNGVGRKKRKEYRVSGALKIKEEERNKNRQH